MARGRRKLGIAAALALAACTPAPAPAPARPIRIVSLDYCADQYVLELVDRKRIAALSPDATAAFSYHRVRARGLDQVRPRVEDVLALRPDLVIRSYGGGPAAAAFLARARVPVLQIGYAEDLRGVRDNLATLAVGLGEPGRGQARAADFDRRLAALARRAGAGPETLYMTPGGATSGPGTLVHEMLRAAGLANFEQATGWRMIPLETLAYRQPAHIAAAFFADKPIDPASWSSARHPVARATLAARPRTDLEGAWTACGGWFIIDAIEKLAAAR